MGVCGIGEDQRINMMKTHGGKRLDSVFIFYGLFDDDYSHDWEDLCF